MVLEVVASPGLRMRIGSSAREFVEANHSPRDLSARLAEIYDAALS
jgi:glycosyltransferase involved in cell wall biosynthesis